MDTNVLAAFREFVALTDELRKCKDKQGELEKQLQPLQEQLLSIFSITPGLMNLSIDGYNIYLAHQLWARPSESKTATLEALQSLGYGFEDVAGVNSSRLSAIVREFVEEGGQIPEELQKTIVLTEKVDVRARKI